MRTNLVTLAPNPIYVAFSLKHDENEKSIAV